MILVFDVGNSNIKCGLFEGEKLAHSWRMSTKTEQTADEYGISVVSFFDRLGLSTDMVTGIIISSVTPSINYTVEHMCQIYFNLRPLVVGAGIKTGMNIRYDNPKELGTDRIVNAVAAYKLYGGPCIVVDFGTATTFGAVSAEGDFLGGCICPGLKIATEALTQNAAKLPRVELNVPGGVICKNTIAGMQAGIIYGYVGQIEYIVGKMKKELGTDAAVVATGGMASLVATEAKSIDRINPTLTLYGLYYLYQRNQ